MTSESTVFFGQPRLMSPTRPPRPGPELFRDHAVAHGREVPLEVHRPVLGPRLLFEVACEERRNEVQVGELAAVELGQELVPVGPARDGVITQVLARREDQDRGEARAVGEGLAVEGLEDRQRRLEGLAVDVPPQALRGACARRQEPAGDANEPAADLRIIFRLSKIMILKK